jgi:hypothetical protein
MIYQILANLFLLLHLSFVIFAVFGGLLILRWRWIWKLHLPAIVWGFLVQYFVWICPLTDLENYFRGLAGQTGYAGGFIEYYLSAILYPSITPQIHLILAILLIAFNLFVYGYIYWNLRRFP